MQVSGLDQLYEKNAKNDHFLKNLKKILKIIIE